MSLGWKIFCTWKWNHFVLYHIATIADTVPFALDDNYQWFMAMYSHSSMVEFCMAMHTVLNDQSLWFRIVNYMVPTIFFGLIWPTSTYVIWCTTTPLLPTLVRNMYTVYGLYRYMPGLIHNRVPCTASTINFSALVANNSRFEVLPNLLELSTFPIQMAT